MKSELSERVSSDVQAVNVLGHPGAVVVALRGGLLVRPRQWRGVSGQAPPSLPPPPYLCHTKVN